MERHVKFAGGVVGGAAVLLTAQGQSDLEIIIEGLAGVAGGVLGAKIPDWAEPATDSGIEALLIVTQPRVLASPLE